MKVWIGVTMLLCLMAAPRAEAAPLYTTTDLGVSFQLQADGGGQVYDVAGANGAVYAFDKSPVNQIYDRTDSQLLADTYSVYLLQGGNYETGYMQDQLAGFGTGPAHTFLLMVKTLRNQAETPKTASISGVSARQRPGRAANTVRPAHSPRSCKTLELPLLVESTLPKTFDTNT